MLTKIVSGSQTGADRAALDTAIKMGVNTVDGYQKAERQKTGSFLTKCHDFISHS